MTTPTQPTEPPPTPPLSWRLAYHTLGLRLPAQYRAWVARDVASKHFLTRRIGRTIAGLCILVGLFWVAHTAIYDTPENRTIVKVLLVALAAGLLESGKTIVRRALRWQRVDRRGRPVLPQGLAILDNAQAVALGAAALVFFTGAAAVGVDRFITPETARGLRCRNASADVIARLRAGLKDQATQIIKPQAIPFGDSTMVAAKIKQPRDTKESAAVWVVTPREIFELRNVDQADLSATTFSPPTSIDRIGGDALTRVVQCLGEATR